MEFISWHTREPEEIREFPFCSVDSRPITLSVKARLRQPCRVPHLEESSALLVRSTPYIIFRLQLDPSYWKDWRAVTTSVGAGVARQLRRTSQRHLRCLLPISGRVLLSERPRFSPHLVCHDLIERGLNRTVSCRCHILPARWLGAVPGRWGRSCAHPTADRRRRQPHLTAHLALRPTRRVGHS